MSNKDLKIVYEHENNVIIYESKTPPISNCFKSYIKEITSADLLSNCLIVINDSKHVKNYYYYHIFNYKSLTIVFQYDTHTIKGLKIYCLGNYQRKLTTILDIDSYEPLDICVFQYCTGFYSNFLFSFNYKNLPNIFTYERNREFNERKQLFNSQSLNHKNQSILSTIPERKKYINNFSHHIYDSLEIFRNGFIFVWLSLLILTIKVKFHFLHSSYIKFNKPKT